jgi:2,5-diketo-D-gluconate reductase B
VEHVIATPRQGERVRIPAIGFGTWPLRGRACREAVKHALSIGYRHLDTARMYRNEAEVGEGIRDSGVDRDELLVVTKIRPGDADRAGVRREVEASLSALGLDRIDLLLLHAPGAVPVEETMQAFREQQEAGRLAHVGVSNFSVEQLERADEHAPVACVQNEFHPGRDQDEVLAWCRERDRVLVAYSPLTVEGRAADVLASVAEAHGRTWAQVALRWLVQHEQVAAIPRSSDPVRRQQNLDVFDFELTDEEMARITQAR